MKENANTAALDITLLENLQYISGKSRLLPSHLQVCERTTPACRLFKSEQSLSCSECRYRIWVTSKSGSDGLYGDSNVFYLCFYLPAFLIRWPFRESHLHLLIYTPVMPCVGMHVCATPDRSICTSLSFSRSLSLPLPGALLLQCSWRCTNLLIRQSS